MNAAGCMKALCMAGRIILENGGETYRAEDTVLRMARALGLEDPDVFAIPSGLFISFTDDGGELRTSVSRVYLRGTHLMRIDRVNQISRWLCDGALEPDELNAALSEASRLGENRAWWQAPLSAFVSAAGFAVMFGGGWIDILLGGLCAALTQIVPLFLRGSATGAMVGSLIGSVLCAFVPMVMHALTGICNVYAIIAASIMPLVPGLSMTNAVQDILRGDMVSGVAHCARAIMIAAMVAGGALAGMRIFEMLPVTSPAPVHEAALPFAAGLALALIGSFFAGAGFGALLFASRKAVWWGGVLGAAGYTGYWLVLQGHAPETAAMFIGALIASVGAQLAARTLKMISTVFVTISILPLVPGLGLYRAMSAMAQGDMDAGAATGTHTMALILMIALGIGLGSAIRRPPAVRPRRKDGLLK